jgi:hypothetical protein
MRRNGLSSLGFFLRVFVYLTHFWLMQNLSTILILLGFRGINDKELPSFDDVGVMILLDPFACISGVVMLLLLLGSSPSSSPLDSLSICMIVVEEDDSIFASVLSSISVISAQEPKLTSSWC